MTMFAGFLPGVTNMKAMNKFIHLFDTQRETRLLEGPDFY